LSLRADDGPRKSFEMEQALGPREKVERKRELLGPRSASEDGESWWCDITTEIDPIATNFRPKR
jgi:hypothetical protein